MPNVDARTWAGIALVAAALGTCAFLAPRAAVGAGVLGVGIAFAGARRASVAAVLIAAIAAMAGLRLEGQPPATAPPHPEPHRGGTQDVHLHGKHGRRP